MQGLEVCTTTPDFTLEIAPKASCSISQNSTTQPRCRLLLLGFLIVCFQIGLHYVAFAAQEITM